MVWVGRMAVPPCVRAASVPCSVHASGAMPCVWGWRGRSEGGSVGWPQWHPVCRVWGSRGIGTISWGPRAGALRVLGARNVCVREVWGPRAVSRAGIVRRVAAGGVVCCVCVCVCARAL